jgi:hypothetical protein
MSHFVKQRACKQPKRGELGSFDNYLLGSWLPQADRRIAHQKIRPHCLRHFDLLDVLREPARKPNKFLYVPESVALGLV